MALASMKSLKASRLAVQRSSRGALQVCANARVDKCKKTDIIVSPSILSANFSKLGEEVRPLKGRCRVTGIRPARLPHCC